MELEKIIVKPLLKSKDVTTNTLHFYPKASHIVSDN